MPFALQLFNDDKESARTAYLEKHPDAFWVTINLNVFFIIHCAVLHICE